MNALTKLVAGEILRTRRRDQLGARRRKDDTRPCGLDSFALLLVSADHIADGYIQAGGQTIGARVLDLLTGGSVPARSARQAPCRVWRCSLPRSHRNPNPTGVRERPRCGPNQTQPTSTDQPRPTRLQLGGTCGATDELLLAATAQNLRKLAKIFPASQQPCKA